MEFLSATKLIQDSLCPFRRKNEPFQENDHLNFGKAVDAGVSRYLRGANFAEEFAKEAGALNLPLSEEYQNRADKCFKTLVNADEDWLKLNRENILTIQSDDGEATYHGNTFFEIAVGKDWGLRGALDYADRFGLSDQGDRIDDLYDFERMKKHVIRIIDWKTGWSDADDLQTAVYAMASWMKYSYLREIYDEQGIETIIQTRFFYLDQGGKSPKRYWDKNNLVSAFHYINARVQEFRKRKDFPRKLNKLCYCCNLADKCQIYQEVLTDTPRVAGIEKLPSNLPVIAERLEEITAIRKIAEKAEKELKEAQAELLLPMGKTGYICGERVYTATESISSYEYDLPSIFEGAQNLIDRPPFQLMKFDSGAYDDLIKETKDAVIKKALKQLKEDHRLPKSTSIKVTSRINQFSEEVDEDESDKVAQQASPETENAVVVDNPVVDSPVIDSPVIDIPQTENQKPLRGYLCAECRSITCARENEAPDACKCGNVCLNVFENLKEAQQFLVVGKDKPAFLCTSCGCAGDFEGQYPGKCVFCGELGPWRVVINPMELKQTQQELVAAAPSKNTDGVEA